MRRYHFINRLVIISGVVAALPLTVGFLLIQHSAKTRLSDAAGRSFVLFAENAASAVDMVFLSELELLSSVATMKPEARSADHLAALERSTRPYREILVLSPTGDVLTASEEHEPAGHAGDEGLKKALWNVTAKKETSDTWAVLDAADDLLTLYVPIQDPESKEVHGFVRGSIDTERLFRGVSDVRFGETGHACLFERDSGRVLAGPSTHCAVDGIYVRFRDYQRAVEQRARYFLGGVRGPASFDRADAELVGYARPELSVSFFTLDWIVVVEQSLAETHAPLAPLSRDLILYFLGMGVLVVVLAGALSYVLEKPTTGVEIDLHEERARTNV